jgi:AraC-like DNA-binding protein
VRKYFTSTDAVVPIHHPRVLVETAVEGGADRGALLRVAGILPSTMEDPDGKISYAQFSDLERAAEELTGDPGIALRWGRAMCFSHVGLAGLAAMSSSNLREAFRIAKQYYLQVTPGWELDLRVEGQRGIVRFEESIDRGDLLRFATEALASAVFSLVHQAIGRKPPVISVRFKFPRPAHVHLYEEFIGDGAFYFDEPATEAEFDASILDERLATHAPLLSQRLEEYTADAAAKGVRVSGLVGEVRRVMLEAGPRRLNPEQVARALQTSTRSLRRSLREMGTSYQQITDRILREQAEARIRDDVKVELVAEELGFTDARSFRRAFKRWTGKSPNEFRRRAR